ncbi:hypothetical protein [Candidatus Palauibacter sp.]|uniref:hypothetical protein n=1 Tax=Candidatus Palauibacter sp. TaxID=3101350 RepID=UPI003B018820
MILKHAAMTARAAAIASGAAVEVQVDGVADYAIWVREQGLSNLGEVGIDSAHGGTATLWNTAVGPGSRLVVAGRAYRVREVEGMVGPDGLRYTATAECFGPVS